MLRAALTIGLGLLAIGEPADVRGPQRPLPELTLTWEGPNECPDAAEQRDLIAAYVDTEAKIHPLVAKATIVRSPSGWRMEITTDDHVRTVRGASCTELSRAAAIIISLALAPEPVPMEEIEVPPQPEPKPDPEPASPPPPDPEPVVAPVVVPPDDDTPRTDPELIRGLVRVDSGIGAGVTPTLTTARLAAGVAGRGYRVELAGTLWAPADASTDRNGVVTRVTLGSTQVRGCGVPRSKQFEFPLCAGIALGALRVDDLVTPRVVTHSFWAGVTFGAALVWRFRPRFALWFGPEATVALQRPTVALNGPNPEASYRSGAAAVRGALGIEIQLSSRRRRAAGKK